MRTPLLIVLLILLVLGIFVWLRPSRNQSVRPQAAHGQVLERISESSEELDGADSLPFARVPESAPSELPPLPPEQPAVTHSILVIDDNSQDPIAGATVRISEDFSATTVATGLVSIQATPPVQIAITAQGYSPAFVLLESVASGTTVIALHSSGQIDGIVLINNSPAPDAYVLAWPSEANPPNLSRGRAALVSPPDALTRSDSLGRFRLNNLDPYIRYSCVAVCKRFGSPMPIRNISCDSGAIELHLKPLYGVTITLQDEDGGPLYVDARLDPEGLPYAIPPGIQLIPFPSPLLGLSDVTDVPTRQGVASHVLLCTMDEDRADAGPFQYMAQAPGYAQEVQEVWALPFDHGELAEHALRLQRLSGPFGSVDLDLNGIEQWPQECEGTIAQLVLFQNGLQYTYTNNDLSSQWRIDHLPYGEYRGRLWFSDTASLYPLDGAFSFALSSPNAQWSIDLSALSALEIVIYNKDGTRYSGPWQANLLAGLLEVDKGFISSPPIHRKRAPYAILGVASPTVTLAPVFPPPSAFGLSHPEQYPAVSMQPGATEHVVLHLLQ